MKVTKTTYCDIYLDEDDAVSNIRVNGAIHEHEKLGSFVQDNVPNCVCNRLHVSSGAVLKNVNVCSDGYIEAHDATIDKLHVGRGGTAVIFGGTVTNIQETCGKVELMDYNDDVKPYATFEPATYGHVHESGCDMSIHSGVVYSSGSLNNGAIMIHSGGELHQFHVWSSYITVRSGGSCDQLIIEDLASLRPYGGTVTNVEIRSGGKLELTHLSFKDEGEFVEPLKNTSNITVSGGGTVCVRYYEGDPIPDYSSLKLEDGACVEEIKVIPDDDEVYNVRYMEDGHLTAYVEADPNIDEEN